MESTKFTSNLKREEIWKPIKDYEGLYEISNFGNVRSLDRVVICKDGRKFPIKGKNKTVYKNRNGYLQVNLNKNNKLVHKEIHRLIAESFIENKNNLPIVNHIDENQLNNDISNFEWCSDLHNSLHSRHKLIGLIKKCKTNTGEHHITKCKHGKKIYCVTFKVYGKNCIARFSNLDEALAYRNRKIDEIEKKYREKENEFIQ